MQRAIPKIVQPISRARIPILSVGGVYLISILLGIMMVHSGNPFALHARDKVVSNAVQHNPITIAYNQGNILGAALLDYCRAELATYKCPRSVDFVEQLPRDENGKLYKRRLREQYWRGHESLVV